VIPGCRCLSGDAFPEAEFARKRGLAFPIAIDTPDTPDHPRPADREVTQGRLYRPRHEDVLSLPRILAVSVMDPADPVFLNRRSTPLGSRNCLRSPGMSSSTTTDRNIIFASNGWYFSAMTYA
jgi:hypothetical protein